MPFLSGYLRKCVQAAGLRVIRAYTRSSMATGIYECSRQIRLHGKAVPQGSRPGIGARAFAWMEKSLVAVGRDVGEEVCLLAQKPAEGRP
jgi:hypothetical protein